MEQFGAYLKAEREKRGIRLEEIASITKIHIHSLELLEASRWAQLPPEPFLRGFIIAYAKYIGLDPKQSLTKYQECMRPAAEAGTNQSPAKVVSVATPPAESPAPGPKKIRASSSETPGQVIEGVRLPPTRRIVAFASLGVAAIIGVSLIYVGKRSLRHSPQTEEVADNSFAPSKPQVRGTAGEPSSGQVSAPIALAAKPLTNGAVGGTAVASTAPASTTNTAISEKAAESAVPAPKVTTGHQLAVEVRHECWVKIVTDDAPPIQTHLKEGEKAVYSAEKKIKLVLGNSAGATVLHNGEPTTGKKYNGTIRFYVFPTGARFPQDPGRKKLASDSSDDDDDSSSND